MTVIHANFGGAPASPSFRSAQSLAPSGLSAAEVFTKMADIGKSVLAERSAITSRQRLDRAEELVQAAIRNFAAGGLTQMRIGSAMIYAATIMGAPD